MWCEGWIRRVDEGHDVGYGPHGTPLARTGSRPVPTDTGAMPEISETNNCRARQVQPAPNSQSPRTVLRTLREARRDITSFLHLPG